MRGFLTVLTTSLTTLALASPASAECANADLVPTADNLPLVSEALLCLHNEARAKAHRPLLAEDSRLQAAAQSHSDDMVAQGYFAHDAPSGVNPFDRMRAAGYIGRGIVWNAGETIAWAPAPAATPRSVMKAWMNATSQRLTLLAPDFRHIGIGITLGAPVPRAPGAAPAVTYSVEYGWRISQRALRRCLRTAQRKTGPVRRAMRAKCHGLGRRAASALVR